MLNYQKIGKKTQSKISEVGYILLDQSIPSSILPALPVSKQLEFISNSLYSVINYSDKSQKDVFTRNLWNIENKEINFIFNDENHQDVYFIWKGENIRFIDKREIYASELFNNNLKILQKVRSELRNITWILILTKDRTLIFFLSRNHFLLWSEIISSLESIFIAIILLEGKLLYSQDDISKWVFYETGKKQLIKVMGELYDKIFVNNYNDKFLESLYLRIYNNMNKIKQDILKQVNNKLTLIHNDSIDLKEINDSIIFLDYSKIIKNSMEYFLKQNSSDEVLKELFDVLLKISKKSKDIHWLFDINSLFFLELFSFIVQKRNSIKNSGIYYTPTPLVELLVIQTMNNYIRRRRKVQISNIRVFDPAMGTGIILIFALEWLVNFNLEHYSVKGSLISLRSEIISKNIFGNELDKTALTTGLAIIQDFFGITTYQEIKTENILISNFIESTVEKVKNNNPIRLFNVILTNPPYIAFHSRFAKKILTQKDLISLNEIIPIFSGKRDNLYLIFLGICLKYLLRKRDGTLGIVIDHSFLDLPSYAQVREYILENYSLVFVLEEYTYYQAAVDLSVLIIETRSNKDLRKTMWQDKFSNVPKLINTEHFNISPHFMFLYRKIPAFFSRILEKSINLGEIASLSCGLEYGALLKSKFLSSHKKNKTWYRVIDGSNGLPDQYILFWIPGLANSYVRFDKSYERELVETNKNISKTNKKVLLISGSLKRFQSPKIILRQTASRFIASYDDQQLLSLRNTHLIHSVKQPYSIYGILAILNSSLGNWLGKHMNIIRKEGKNRYPQIRLNSLKKFPIRRLDQTDDHQLTLEIDNQVKRCLQIGKNITENLISTWKIFKASGFKKFSTQRQFLRQCLDEELSFSLLNEVDTEHAETIIKSLRKNLKELKEQKIKLDYLVFELYGITENEQIEILT